MHISLSILLPTLNSLFTFPKSFLLPLHYYCYQSVWSVPVMLCNNCCLQSTLCLWLWLVLTFGYVLLYNNCPYSRHNVLLLLNILYHHYWASQLPHLQTECAIALQSTGHTHVYAYTYAHTHHTHTLTCNYIPHHPLSLQCWRFADSCSLLTGWQYIQKGPGGEQPSQQQATGGLDTWWLWCLLGEHGEGTHQEHIC